MPLKEFECPKCGTVFEKLCKINDSEYKCPKCGEMSSIRYIGKCNGVKGGGCGDCSCCKGCKH
jgi:putative FmdB family regulatory protein